MSKIGCNWRKAEFKFDDKATMFRFILLYRDLFHPWSKQTKDRVIIWSAPEKDLRDPVVRAAADEGYVISGNTVTTLLRPSDRDYILYGTGLKFEEIIYNKGYNNYRKYYKYVSSKD